MQRAGTMQRLESRCGATAGAVCDALGLGRDWTGGYRRAPYAARWGHATTGEAGYRPSTVCAGQ